VTIQPQVVNKYSRNQTVRMLNASITKCKLELEDNSIQKAVQIAANLYLSSDNDNTISNSTKDSNPLNNLDLQ
jgi:hypothetical protein